MQCCSWKLPTFLFCLLFVLTGLMIGEWYAVSYHAASIPLEIKNSLIPKSFYGCIERADPAPCYGLPLIYINARPEAFMGQMLEMGKKGLAKHTGGVSVYTVNTKHKYSTHQVTVAANLAAMCGRPRIAKHSNHFLTFAETFAKVLKRFPQQEYFLIFEDDVIVYDGPGFFGECAGALKRKEKFFSFYDAFNTNCDYGWGTQAQLMHRSVMEEVCQKMLYYACRVPVDIYLGRQRKYKKSRNKIVEHHGAVSAPTANKNGRR